MRKKKVFGIDRSISLFINCYYELHCTPKNTEVLKNLFYVSSCEYISVENMHWTRRHRRYDFFTVVLFFLTSLIYSPKALLLLTMWRTIVCLKYNNQLFERHQPVMAMQLTYISQKWMFLSRGLYFTKIKVSFPCLELT